MTSTKRFGRNVSIKLLEEKESSKRKYIGRSSNGRTTVSGTVNLGSSPSLPASVFDIV